MRQSTRLAGTCICLLLSTTAAAVDWPVGDDGLVLAYGGRNSLLTAIQADGTRNQFYGLYTQLRPYGLARRDRFGGMVMGHGWWQAADQDAVLAGRAAASGAFAFEAWVEPRIQTAGSTGIIAALIGDGGHGFAIRQDGADIVLTMNGGTGAKLFELADAKPFHLAVSWSGGTARAWRDGIAAGERALPGATAAWGPGSLVFGGAPDGTQAWSGRLEAVIVRSRALAADEPRRDAEAATALRGGRVDRSVLVRVKPLKLSRPPTLDSIAPYFSALVASTYEVVAVVRGTCEQKEIAVYQWGILAEAFTSYRTIAGPDGTVLLELEPWSLYVNADGSGPFSNEHRVDDLDGRLGSFAERTWFDLGTTWLDAGPGR